MYLHLNVLTSITNNVTLQFSHSVVSDSLRPHESQPARPLCPSPTPGVHSNLCASSWWCHPANSSSVIPFSSCPQSLPSSGSFPMSQLFTWGGQSIGVSVSASVLPMNTQDWLGTSISDYWIYDFYHGEEVGYLLLFYAWVFVLETYRKQVL